MIMKTLYRYTREDGGTTVSTEAPADAECTVTYRLIADEGMELVKGDIRTSCVDTDDAEGWTEVHATERMGGEEC